MDPAKVSAIVERAVQKKHDFAAQFPWSSRVLPSFYLELCEYLNQISCVIFKEGSLQMERVDSVKISDSEREPIESASPGIPKF